MYFPLFWWKDSDKERYVQEHDIIHSDAYKVYGLKRTGCAGCPFGQTLDHEISVCAEHEPKLHKGIIKIFADSYEWTAKYKAFAQEKRENR